MTDRAQTTLDFAIGVSIFLVAVVFVLAFAPGMFDSFNDGPQEQTVVAGRVADQLGEGMLAAPTRPYVLEGRCTVAFFNSSVSDAGCRFDNDTAVEDRVGVDRLRLNVTLERDVDGNGQLEVVCQDGTSATRECSAGDTRLAAGSDVATAYGSVVVAQRSVTVGATPHTLVVRVW